MDWVQNTFPGMKHADWQQNLVIAAFLISAQVQDLTRLWLYTWSGGPAAAPTRYAISKGFAIQDVYVGTFAALVKLDRVDGRTLCILLFIHQHGDSAMEHRLGVVLQGNSAYVLGVQSQYRPSVHRWLRDLAQLRQANILVTVIAAWSVQTDNVLNEQFRLDLHEVSSSVQSSDSEDSDYEDDALDAAAQAI
jgi:hypothetical protein